MNFEPRRVKRPCIPTNQLRRGLAVRAVDNSMPNELEIYVFLPKKAPDFI
jgi:hypothetical protein